MSGCTKRCFESVAALQRITPQVLRDMLATFKEFCFSQKIKLPTKATRENLDYDVIGSALMGNKVPAEMDDIMFYASRLGNGNHWHAVERQAKEDDRTLFSDPKLTYLDQAILLAIEDWPKNKHFLERANARAYVHGKSAFVYYAPSADFRSLYTKPTDEQVTILRNSLIEHFVNCGLVQNKTHGHATEIILYEYENEIWFLIRYPGKIKMQTGASVSGEWESHAYNPEQYDVVVYNKVYGDLRMNTHRKKEHLKYRIGFSKLLFGDEVMNVFQPKAPVVTLMPLLQDKSVEIFNTGDITGLDHITPIEIRYEPWDLTGQTITWSAEPKGSLLSGYPNGDCVLEEGVLITTRMIVEYKLSNGRKGKLTIHQSGNRLNYERDGDSIVLEKWLRRRGFVKSLPEEAHASKAA